ncbi:serine O-acetyltransferase EpsC [Desulfoplanes formicivorans]|nr:serine O-acetyltransferase EpsC [Desulfoplanes formicivorans]
MTQENNAPMPQNDIDAVVQALCQQNTGSRVCLREHGEAPMPSVDILASLVHDLRSVLFPGYFGPSDVSSTSMRYHIGGYLDRVQRSLGEQILRGECFVCRKQPGPECLRCETKSHDIAWEFIHALPRIRHLLTTDVDAAYVGDPAAKTPGETIFCYPSISALIHHRVAHELYKFGVPIIPRIISEMAHSQTGIDIHPGASIGEHFFIDHGTGTVIGETCIIGKNVRIYQGVTLGAKSFPKGKDGSLVKGLARHPIVEDDVTIYAGATILGRVRLGQGATIGGNVWITRDIPAGAQIRQSRPMEASYEQGAGI